MARTAKKAKASTNASTVKANGRDLRPTNYYTWSVIPQRLRHILFTAFPHEAFKEFEKYCLSVQEFPSGIPHVVHPDYFHMYPRKTSASNLPLHFPSRIDTATQSERLAHFFIRVQGLRDVKSPTKVSYHISRWKTPPESHPFHVDNYLHKIIVRDLPSSTPDNSNVTSDCVCLVTGSSYLLNNTSAEHEHLTPTIPITIFYNGKDRGFFEW